MSQTEDIIDQVRKTKEIMINNIDLLFARGKKLEALRDKTATLEEQAKLFAEAARDLQNRAKNRYLALTLILIGVSIGAIYTIIYGYQAPVVLIGSFAGGVVGYATSWLYNSIVSNFFPSEVNQKPTANFEHTSKNDLEDDLELKLGASNDILNAFRASDTPQALSRELTFATIKNRLKF